LVAHHSPSPYVFSSTTNRQTMRKAEGTGVFKKFWGCAAVIGFG
jgi:hypothetical protein